MAALSVSGSLKRLQRRSSKRLLCHVIVMAASSARHRVLQLYKRLLREAGKFNAYNYRTYALRRVKDAFRENKTASDAEKIEELYQYGIQNLKIIQRQTVIGMLYGAPKLVIEQQEPLKADK